MSNRQAHNVAGGGGIMAMEIDAGTDEYDPDYVPPMRTDDDDDSDGDDLGEDEETEQPPLLVEGLHG